MTEERRNSLSKVFKTLEENDLIARMDFSCCDTCAHPELDRIVQKTEGKKGYVFFHGQNTNRLLERGRELYLGFGRPDDNQEDLTEIGERVVSIFNEMEYETKWDGDSNTKILVYIEEEDILDMKPIWEENRMGNHMETGHLSYRGLSVLQAT